MDRKFIEKAIEINTTPKKLWRTITDPAVTREMGGEYISDWQIGSSLSWKGTDGHIYTNGTILQLEPEMILQHSLFNLDEKEKILSVITYKFDDNKESTTLHAREDYSISLTDKEYEEASGGWDFALKVVKQTAENLK